MTPESIRAAGEVIAGLGKRSAAVLNRARYDLSATLAWGLVTWGIWGYSARVWAISIGAYLMLSAILAAVAGMKKPAPLGRIA